MRRPGRSSSRLPSSAGRTLRRQGSSASSPPGLPTPSSAAGRCSRRSDAARSRRASGPSPRPRSSSRTTSCSARRSRRWRRRSRSSARTAVEPALFNEVLTEGLFAAPAYKVYGTIIAEQDYDRVGFTTELALKDVDLTLAAAGRPTCRCRAPPSSATACCLRSPTATASATGPCLQGRRRA